MRRAVLGVMLCLAFLVSAFAESRFNRPVVKFADKGYTFIEQDGNKLAIQNGTAASVACIVYRGAIYYYVELQIFNHSNMDVVIERDFVSMNKPGYTVVRVNTTGVAMQMAGTASGRFVPTPAPQMPSNSTTTFSGTGTTYGNTTRINGTATTTQDTSAQAGANFGNAIGNAIAAHRYYNAQAAAQRFAVYLPTVDQANVPPIVEPGKTQTIIATFSQPGKHKKAPFDVAVRLNGEEFVFKLAE